MYQMINFTSNSTYLAVVVVPGRILVDFGFLAVAVVPVPPTKSPWDTISGGL